MIGYLKGHVAYTRSAEIWLLVGGVGYRVRVGERLRQAVTTGEDLELFIHTHVREDEITLYGFADFAELLFFETLLSASGVGPKIALTIVGTQAVERVSTAIQEADVGFFTKVPGIGKKGAQRIIVDLKGKLGSLKELDLNEDLDGDDDVTLALMQFGFKRPAIELALEGLDSTLPAEVRVREGLRRLGKKI